MSRGLYDKVNKVLIPTAGSEIPNVDSELSTTSTNPVQNKVVTTALNTKANASDVNTQIQTLTNSVAPTENGTNYSKTYYKGDEFYRNGVLYKVTASSVNSSTAINTASGGNATAADSVTSQIKSLDSHSVLIQRVGGYQHTFSANEKFSDLDIGAVPTIPAGYSNVILLGAQAGTSTVFFSLVTMSGGRVKAYGANIGSSQTSPNIMLVCAFTK